MRDIANQSEGAKEASSLRSDSAAYSLCIKKFLDLAAQQRIIAALPASAGMNVIGIRP
jgi:hypothetical protein